MEANNIPNYYWHQPPHVQVDGAAFFSTAHEGKILNTQIFEWCASVKARLPRGALELPGAFSANVYATMSHIFAASFISWAVTLTNFPTEQH